MNIISIAAICKECRKVNRHEPWCQSSPDAEAFFALDGVRANLTEPIDAERAFELAKRLPGAEALTLDMTREILQFWVAETGEMVIVDGKYQRMQNQGERNAEIQEKAGRD